ncbi:MAG: hypothetical protein SF172_12795 [Burkholderiales bacterium]|nr:hypothetical protein [Burkholderiales bacterium]
MKPPRDDINWWPLYIVLLVVSVGVVWWGLSLGGQVAAAVMLGVPLFGWVASRIIINGVEKLAEAKHAAEWADLNGIHYAYGPHELRAIEFEDQLWFYEQDILQAANIRSDTLTRLFPARERRPLENTKLFVLNEAGIEHLLMKHPDPEAKRFLMFLRREAFFPWKRAHGQKVDAPVPR